MHTGTRPGLFAELRLWRSTHADAKNALEECCGCHSRDRLLPRIGAGADQRPVDRGRSPKAADRSDRHSETRIALTAAAHVMPAQKCAVYADLDTFTEHKIDPVLGGMEVKNGMVTLPDGPGLGVDVAPAFLKTLHAA